MSKVETITPQILKEIREKLNPVIEKFMLDNYGLSASLGNATYTNKTADFKLSIKGEGVSDVALQYAKLYGWPEIGVKFRNGGKDFEVIDYDIKKRARPIIAKDEATGKRFCFVSEDVLRLSTIK